MISAVIVAASLSINLSPEVSDMACRPLPPTATNVDVAFSDGERSDGSKYWESSAVYELSRGYVGEARIVMDQSGAGEAYFAVDGDIVAHASVENNEVHGPSVVTWFPAQTNYPAEILAELLQLDVGNAMLDGMVPQEFKCSKFGRGAVKGAKYAWYAISGALAATCCAGSFSVGCAICAGGAMAAAEAGGDAFDAHCE